MVKKFFVILLVTLILVSFGNYFYEVYGIDAMEEINRKREATTSSGSGSEKMVTATQKLAGTFLTIFKVVGVGVALIMLIVLAIKYMLAAPGDKADIKKHAVVYIVGAICLFGATGIVSIIEKLFSEEYTAVG